MLRSTLTTKMLDDTSPMHGCVRHCLLTHLPLLGMSLPKIQGRRYHRLSRGSHRSRCVDVGRWHLRGAWTPLCRFVIIEGDPVLGERAS